MNKQLLPCPFCGGEIRFDPKDDWARNYPAFQCLKGECGVEFELPYEGDSANEDALGFWENKHPIKKEKPTSKSKGTYEEVAEFCKSIGLPVTDAEYFFNKCEGCGWTNGGKPIKDWRATIRSWKAAGYMPSCKMTVVPNKATIPKWKQIQTIEEQLETHPANPSFRGYRADKVTPEQREHYENQKDNLKRLKGELI